MKNERLYYSKRHKAWSAKSILEELSDSINLLQKTQASAELEISREQITPCCTPRCPGTSQPFADHGTADASQACASQLGGKQETTEGFVMASVTTHLCQAAVSQ